MSAEDDRAAAYRAQASRRAAAVAARERALAGDRDAAKAVFDAWEPRRTLPTDTDTIIEDDCS